MAKTSKSQWDFGELFPAEALRKVYSVTELTGQIRRALESQLGEVWVTGEITNYKLQGSGHAYFTLKDATAQISCVLFRSEPGINRALLQDGRHITARGQLTVYEPRGQYQLKIASVELRGEGALQAAFEKLKKELQAEGLFNQERKRPLPRFPARAGLVTSPSGAAIQDILHVVQRRNPGLQLVLASCRVQGQGAAREIACAIRLLNEFHRQQMQSSEHGLDLILVARGGGSLEDLWAFNEVEVARAVFSSEVPVVSAVGHEIDFTICDFVADLRAATPSAAAEIITEGVFSSCEFFAQCGSRLRMLCQQRMKDFTDAVQRCSRALDRLHPRRELETRQQRVDELEECLRRCAIQSLRHSAATQKSLGARLLALRPAVALASKAEEIASARRQLRASAASTLQQHRARLQGALHRLRLLGPEHVLARGYSITMQAATGAVLRQPSDAAPGDKLITKLVGGQIRSTIDPA